MKINGQPLAKPSNEILVIPRNDEKGEPCDIVFVFQAVPTFTEFDEMCPRPQPRAVLKADGTETVDTTHKKFQDAITEYAKKRLNWQFLKSLEATPGLEWEKVNLQNSETWEDWKQELSEQGITDHEQDKMFGTFLQANSMSERMFQDAKDRFLASGGLQKI